jgi:hypothetical protein
MAYTPGSNIIEFATRKPFSIRTTRLKKWYLKWMWESILYFDDSIFLSAHDTGILLANNFHIEDRLINLLNDAYAMGAWEGSLQSDIFRKLEALNKEDHT